MAHIEVPREPRSDDGGVNLATALQYGPATGLKRTQEFFREFTERVYAPAYDDWTTLIHAGNTDGYAVHIICRVQWLIEVAVFDVQVGSHCQVAT